MADSKPLRSLDGDTMAAEALLRDVFGIVLDEIIRKGTSASEKVGADSLLPVPIHQTRLRTSLPEKASPQNWYCVSSGLGD